MPHRERIKPIADKNGGIFRTSDLTRLGYDSNAIRRLTADQIIERIKPSYYRLYEPYKEPSEATRVAQLYPDGVLCMYTALFYYKYSDQMPLEWDIAVDRDTSKARFKLDYPCVRPHYMKKEYLSFGVERAVFDDCTIQMFDRDRLVCECIFNETKMDRETFNKAIQRYITDPNKNVVRLLEYAEKRRILKKVKERIGVWL